MTEARNSSIELLRIIAMMMIISHHYIVGSQINTLAQPISFHKLFADCILRPGGKIGVTIFFLITAWFLSSMKEASSKKCFRKILQIEKEMLFYSITICIFSFLFLKDYFSNRYFLISFFPTIFRLWWYPTSYIVFLLLFPFLHIGLQRIGKGLHKRLCCVSFFIWGILAGIFPDINLDITAQNMIIFIYIYILITYYRWYMKPIAAKTSVVLILVSFLFIVLNITTCALLFRYSNNNYFLTISDTWISHEWKLPVLGAAFGIFNLFVQKHFSSKTINTIASTTFGIFLFHNHPLINEVLRHSLFDFSTYYFSKVFYIFSILTILIVFFSGMILDFCRQLLFNLLSNPLAAFDTRVLHIYNSLTITAFKLIDNLSTIHH